MSDPLILSLIPKGSPEHPRFLIANQLCEYWTGAEWSHDEDHALLFVDEATAGCARTALLAVYDHDKSVFRVTAPVEIEIRSNSAPDLRALQLWLMQAARLYVDYRQCGNGPTDDGVVLMSIDWKRLLRETQSNSTFRNVPAGPRLGHCYVLGMADQWVLPLDSPRRQRWG